VLSETLEIIEDTKMRKDKKLKPKMKKLKASPRQKVEDKIKVGEK
jgi:hypothetical protein